MCGSARRVVTAVSLVVLAVGLTPVATAAARTPKTSAVALPIVTGPVTGGRGTPTLATTSFDLGRVGYEGNEYFLDGTATSYRAAGTLGPDGRWKVTAANALPYKTRIVVYRPKSAKTFDGTVFVEWLNVTAGFDSAPDWLGAHAQIIRAGAAWLGVSAQAVGVQGGAPSVSAMIASGGLRSADPTRYATLSHPGDAYSYDIFSQAGLVARGSAADNPMRGLKVRRVIAIGESQSAFRMVTYVNAIHPIAHVYDGFLVHSRGGSGAGLRASLVPGMRDPQLPASTIIRTDIDVPVFTFETESDVIRLGFLPSRQPDSAHFRLWEVAGTSHADSYFTGGVVDLGQGDAERALLDPANVTGGPLSCAQAINNGPAFAVLSAAVFHLERWVRDRTLPPRAPRLETTTSPPAIVRDAHGIAKGGIRTPLVDAPIATLSGDPNAGGSFCYLFGRTIPFDASTLASLYPTHADYVKRFDASADRAVERGFLLERNADNFKAAAAALAIGGPA
jgi:hypothetical protein